jgi:hypothetical protein
MFGGVGNGGTSLYRAPQLLVSKNYSLSQQSKKRLLGIMQKLSYGRKANLLAAYAHGAPVQSVGVPPSKNLDDRLDQDQKIKPETPIINIPKIELHARCGMFD